MKKSTVLFILAIVFFGAWIYFMVDYSSSPHTPIALGPYGSNVVHRDYPLILRLAGVAAPIIAAATCCWAIGEKVGED